jgi:glycosyltransferase involved in cell wall biosynthesis
LIEMNQKTTIIIPAFNESLSISKVIQDIPKEWVEEIIVVDNGSDDNTAELSEKAGATVLMQPVKGYGMACLTGLDYIRTRSTKQLPSIVTFLDGDYSDYPADLPLILTPIWENQADMVIGSRVLGERDKGALLPHQAFGNWLATKLIKLIFSYSFTDLGPFRAIRYNKLVELSMEDKNYGWTAEMQVKAAVHKFNIAEVPVRYRKRIGVSKVSGTIAGSLKAGYKILFIIFKYGFSRK